MFPFSQELAGFAKVFTRNCVAALAGECCDFVGTVTGIGPRICQDFPAYVGVTRRTCRHDPWIADRTTYFDASGIRRVFDLAAKLKNPINLSIGQPDFDVPDEIKEATIEAIEGGNNAYSPTQGIAPLWKAI